MCESMTGCKGKVDQRKLICMAFNQRSYAVTSRVKAERSKTEAPPQRLEIYRSEWELIMIYHTLYCVVNFFPSLVKCTSCLYHSVCTI